MPLLGGCALCQVLSPTMPGYEGYPSHLDEASLKLFGTLMALICALVATLGFYVFRRAVMPSVTVRNSLHADNQESS